ncbi:MAG TPA: Maf family protein [Steroidobacteraceae bacterium]
MQPTCTVLCLASASPRRLELLAQIGVACTVARAQIDETARPGEEAAGYVSRLAREKAASVRSTGQSGPVLAADTAVVLEGRIFGKPRDRADAIDMLGRLSGRTHAVLTAVALADAHGLVERLSVSSVRFRAIGAQECAAYWETGEPRDKAGGYAIQGFGAVFVQSLQGSYSGVMGLPLFETAELLRSCGIAAWRGSQPS